MSEEPYVSIEFALNGRKPEQMGKGFWNDLAIHSNITEEDMRKYSEFFNWRKLSDHQKMSESFIREYVDEVHWDRITQRIRMSEQFIDEFADKVVWAYVWSYQKKLSPTFIENHLCCCKYIDWDRIVMYQKLDEKFIFNHFDDLNIYKVLEYQKPDKELFEKLFNYCMVHYKDQQLHGLERKFLYHKIIRWKTLPEKEILRYLELAHMDDWDMHGWFTVITNQKLTEDFIEKHYDKIKKSKSLWYVWKYQKLSEEFKERHKKDFNKHGLVGEN